MPPPALELSDLTIQRTVGPRSFVAGMGYARSGLVRELVVDAQRQVLYAEVQGTQRSPYVVLVSSSASRRWSGRCTCPIGSDCKHVAAVMLAARTAQEVVVAPAPARPAIPSWEAPLAALVRARSEAAATSRAPLGLQLELVDGVRLRVRPVTRGRRDTWVRTGVSFREFQYSAGQAIHDAAHRDVMRAVVRTYVAQSCGWSYGLDAIPLDELGPPLWALLDRARAAGVELVLGKDARVALADPVGVALDLVTTPDGGAVLRPVVTTASGPVATAAVQLLGSPAHGLFATDPDAIDLLAPSTNHGAEPPGLVLAPLTDPLDQHVDDLLRTRRALEVPAEDVPRFLRTYVPALRQAVPLVCGDRSLALPEPVAPALALTVAFVDGHEVDLDWAFTYAGEAGTTRVPIEHEDDEEEWAEGDLLGWPGPIEDGIWRDRAAERRLLVDLDPTDRRTMARGPRLTAMDAVRFTTDVLPELEASGRVDLTVVGARPHFRPAEQPPVIRLTTRDTSDSPDWFDLGVTVSVEDEEVPFDQLFRALAGGLSHLVLPSGRYLSLDQPELQALRRLIDEARDLQDRSSAGVRVSVFSAGLWDELRRIGVVEHQSARWAAAVEGLLDLETIAPPPEPPGLDAVLRPYQRQGYAWLTFLWQHRLGGILADDMGLGKTLQTLAMVCAAREAEELPGPFLVVAPTSVVSTWAQEARRFAPGLKVTTVHETSGKRQTPLAEDVAGADLVVTSYALFRIDHDAYLGLDWAGLVLDEAQAVKNHQGKTYACARRLPAPVKFAITGTPLENTLMELWSLLSIVAPGLHPNPQRFAETYRKPIERGSAPELLATLRRRIRPLVLRRTKAEVAADLPPKQEQVLEVVLNPRHAKVYSTHLQRERRKVLGLLDDLDRNRFEIFRSLTLLRQLSLDPALVDPAYADVRSSKADAFVAQLREVVGEGHRALVFSQFTRFLGSVRDRLDAEGVDSCYLDGRTRHRAAVIDDFRKGSAPVFLISLKAGGVGLTLTEADYCFLLDPWWNPAVEAQAVDRTHRIGQTKPVMVYRLVSAGTIEEKVMELQERKRSLFAQVMDDDALLSAPLSVEDIRGLFG